MAGASALQQVLLEHPKAKLKVLAVWEPVLGLDIAPPSSSNLARLSDPRVEQFWDGGRLLSQRLLSLARAHPERLGPNQREQLAKARTVWDFIVDLTTKPNEKRGAGASRAQPRSPRRNKTA